MSQLITKLINQNVQVSFYSELESYVWTVLEVDEDWVKLTKSTKKGKVTTRLVRVDDIRTIELV
ncbi:aspartyl-tRNA synthetase [Streptococcus cameli]